MENPYTHDIYQVERDFHGLYVSPIVGVSMPFGRHNGAVALSVAYSGIVRAHESVDALQIKLGILF